MVAFLEACSVLMRQWVDLESRGGGEDLESRGGGEKLRGVEKGGEYLGVVEGGETNLGHIV